MTPTTLGRRARRTPEGGDRRSILVLAAMAIGLVWSLGAFAGAALAAPGDDRVLILSTSVTGGASSREAQAAIGQGLGVDVVTPGEWASLTAEDFGAYRAIILGDPACGGIGSAPFIGAAEANAGVWGPMVDGNVLVVGTDPVAHAKHDVTDKGVALAVSEPGKTGAYITLACYYHGTAAGTPVPVLSGLSNFGGFTATGVAGCFDAAHIVAEHPALAGLTDAYLSNWGCSVHEAFDSWPADFVVLAIATTGGAYTASDGTVGTPFIMARGETIQVVSDVTLDGPSSAAVGQVAVFTANVESGGAPVSGATVAFTSTAGPHAGTLGSATTDAGGTAVLSFTGSAVGTDLVVASYVDGSGRTQTSGSVSVNWTLAPDPTPTPTPTPDPTAAPVATPIPSPSSSPDERATPELDVTQSVVAVDDRLDVEVRNLLPGSAADFYLHSSPIHLGTRTADTAGRITTSLLMPAVEPGSHTLVVEGFDSSGQPATLRASVRVSGDTDPLVPDTAMLTPTQYWLAMLLPLIVAVPAALAVRGSAAFARRPAGARER